MGVAQMKINGENLCFNGIEELKDQLWRIFRPGFRGKRN